MTIRLNKPLAGNGGADESDVKQLKKALNRLGYYTPYEKVGITGIPDAGLFAALKKFQKDSGLRAGGTMKPGDETVDALNTAVSQTPPGKYIWHTVGDDRVRADHAALEGEVRTWGDGLEPGEDPNCRCWAEGVKEKKNCDEEEKSWINAEAKLFIAKQALEKATKEKYRLAENLQYLQKQLKKETSVIRGDKGKARNIGGIIGAIAGTIIAGPSGMAPGLSAGANIGPLLEEGSDIVTGQKTDVQIRIEIKETKEKILKNDNKITDILNPAIIKAEDLVRKTRDQFLTCRKSSIHE